MLDYIKKGRAIRFHSKLLPRMVINNGNRVGKYFSKSSEH